MAGKKSDMQKRKLLDQRDKLLNEIEALKNRVMGLEMAISLLDDGNGDSAISSQPTKRRSGVKAVLLDLLQECGTTGINASTAIEIAARRGVILDKGTISSLLSRLKAEGTVVYDGDKYRLRDMPPGNQPFRVVG